MPFIAFRGCPFGGGWDANFKEAPAQGGLLWVGGGGGGIQPTEGRDNCFEGDCSLGGGGILAEGGVTVLSRVPVSRKPNGKFLAPTAGWGRGRVQTRKAPRGLGLQAVTPASGGDRWGRMPT